MVKILRSKDFLFPELLSQLSQNNVRTQSYRYAKNSLRNVISNIRTYVFFITFFSLTFLPASTMDICRFLELMALTCGYGHLKNVLSSLKYLHEAHGFQFPSNDFNLDTTLQGLKRRLAKTPFFVMPITPQILLQMYEHLDMSKPNDLALWCSFLVAFYGLFRKANVVPESGPVDPSQTLTRNHIILDRRNKVVYIHVTFSKTIQFCQRDLFIPVPSNTNPALDLYRHMELLLDSVPAAGTAPAFSFSSSRFISYKLFTNRLKDLLTRSGLSPHMYSGHSFRRGAASFLHKVGGTVLQIQSAGDWSSQCFTRYLYLSTEERMKAQHLVSAALSSGSF